MKQAKRQRLERKGWKVGDARDLLQLTDDEVTYIELKLALSDQLKAMREKKAITQIELAKLLSSSQSRVAKMESGEFVTIRSGNDSNQNGDSAGDRAILNPGGTEGVGSGVTALVRTCPSFNENGTCTTSTASRTIGYRVTNPNAKYVQAGNGAASNLARNTFESPSITNFDITVFKNFRFGEKKVIQIRADFFNAFNHPQYVPGSVNTVDPVATTGVTQYNTLAPLDPGFLKADRIFSSNPRLIQLAARFNF